MLYVVEDRLLFAGDLIFAGRVPFVGNADSARLAKAMDKHDRAASRRSSSSRGTAPRRATSARDLALTRDYLAYLRETMGRAVRDLEPFDDAYAHTDWSRFATLPAFEQANRINAYGTYLLMEQELWTEPSHDAHAQAIPCSPSPCARRARRRASSRMPRATLKRLPASRRSMPTSCRGRRRGSRGCDRRRHPRRISRARDPRRGIRAHRRRARERRLPVARRPDRRHDEFRARLSEPRGIDRAHARRRDHACASCSTRARRALHRRAGKGAQLNGAPLHVSALPAARGCAGRHGVPTRAQLAAAGATCRRSTRSWGAAAGSGAPARARSTSRISPPDASTASG